MPDTDKPKEYLVQYWPLDKPVPAGWVRHGGLDGTHHGQYSCFITPEGQAHPADPDPAL